jgi:RNA polymerase sigma factor (sigma-70 family)
MEALHSSPIVDAQPDDHAAVFEQCYRAHRLDVYRRCLRFAAGREDWAEDLVHDVFLRLHKHLPGLTDLSELRPWLFRVAANLAINRLRDERSLLARLSMLLQPAADETPAADVRHARRQVVEATLRKLPPRERIALCMSVLDGMPQRDIAAALQLSEGYVSKLLARAWAVVEKSGWEVEHAP